MKRNLLIALTALVVSACSGSGSEGVALDRAALDAKLTTIQGSKETHFSSAAEFKAKQKELWQAYKADKSSVRALVRTDDNLRSVARFDLYLLDQLGRVVVGDQVALDHAQLSARAKDVDTSAAPEEPGVSTQALVTYGTPPSFVQQNQGNYKVQGESYQSDYGVYGEQGGTTQFKKYRTQYFYTGWWDTDAEHLSARCVLFFNRSDGVSEAHSVDQDSDSNDDVVTALVSWGVATPGDVSFFDTGLYCFHAVDHGGLWWRLESSISLNSTLDWGNITRSYDVPWVNGSTCTGAGGTFNGCRGSGCFVCKEKVGAYPNYFRNHPRCVLNEGCSGVFGTCNPDCPAPTSADL
jgi:hypothetical protein